jgi:hypothetical protein
MASDYAGNWIRARGRGCDRGTAAGVLACDYNVVVDRFSDGPRPAQGGIARDRRGVNLSPDMVADINGRPQRTAYDIGCYEMP